MPRFTILDASEVGVGRGRAAQEARRPYIQALQTSDAGKIEVARGENPATVKRLLQDSARRSNIRIRSSWADTQQQALYWKKIGGR